MDLIKPVKFTIVPTARPNTGFLASFEITQQDDYFYCHLHMGERVKWEEVRRLISLNYWMEWDLSDPKSPCLRLSKKAFADNLAAPRNSTQAEFSQHLPGILQNPPADWRVVAYCLNAESLTLTFAHDSKTSDSDDLVQLQIDFTRHYICRTDPA